MSPIHLDKSVVKMELIDWHCEDDQSCDFANCKVRGMPLTQWRRYGDVRTTANFVAVRFCPHDQE